jgi:ubiquinone/menaquinone biosynthesis C-methylase UbiE
MKQGDFTGLAKDYRNRAGYSLVALRVLADHVKAKPKYDVADVGAGTGKLTESLYETGICCYAVEPNDDMRTQGIEYTSAYATRWSKGSGEVTGLPNAAVRWVLMGSSFHWTDQPQALAEFYRILSPGGFFTALWNPRDIERSPLHMRIEERIRRIVPELERVSSGSSKYTIGLDEKLESTGHFKNCFFIEARHEVEMSKDRYLGAWQSVNDIQAQAGPQRFAKILEAIKEEIAELESVIVPYKTRAWTVQRVE